MAGRATNFTASGTLNPDDTMFGFDIYIFLKNADGDPTCAADFDSESATAMHSGGNESWVSPAGGFQVGMRPDATTSRSRSPSPGSGNYLLCGYVQGDFSTFASGQLRGVVAAEATAGSQTGGQTGSHGSQPASPTAIPSVVRAPWITRGGPRDSPATPGTWSNSAHQPQLPLVSSRAAEESLPAPQLTVRRSLRGRSVLCRVTAGDAAGARTVSTHPIHTV